MTREEAVNYLLSSGMSGEQIKAVLEPFTHEEILKKEADIIIYIKSDKYYNTVSVAEYLDDVIDNIHSIVDYNIHVLN